MSGRAAALRQEQRRTRRAQVVRGLAIRYPEELPVAQRRDDIAAAIRDHQVVVIAGETGSGKTTQLPKICLELGRGVDGLIGHTQPRRLAARTVADRIAEELGVPLGTAVGYTVRFTDQVSADTAVRLMTDGILLAEIQRDRDLRWYDTIILDEAHERSLNIDFLLGYLKSLLPRRPDLKLIITSATIDPERFAEHFGGAPIVEVSGRTYPVEVRYRPLVDPDDEDPEERDQVTGIIEAVEELVTEPVPGGDRGDILVFLSGEREIRDTAEALRSHVARWREPLEVLPLYARLSAAEQHRVFAPQGARRVVLATNVAETSLTVPGITYVIDPGTARISRYSSRLKVQRLPIEPISQASANQRKGRCGRTSDGICIRLYSEDSFLARPEFTEPEILRTNLASVLLSMTALGLGDIAAFPFVEPPDKRQISDGVALLEELGALVPAKGTSDRRLTPIGKRLAAIPLDPRLARMVLEADRNGCVPDVLVIAAALSIQDPRERPADNPGPADAMHRRFTDDRSDFLAYRNLWLYLQEQQKALSGNAFRRMCKSEHLHYLRVREWQDLVGQLRQVVRGLGIDVKGAHGQPGDEPKPVHVSLLAGLLSHIGMWDPEKREYAGARGGRFAAWPGSALVRKPPRWVMAGELVETSRLWGRDLGRIEPEWVEPLAEHLLKRSYSEPHWSARAGAVMAYEKVLLFGLPIVVARRIAYGRIDPETSRDLFIRHALVQGEWRTHHAFLAENRALLEDVEDLEHRARRRDIVVEDEDLFAFYDERIPAEVVSGRHFDVWWKRARRETPHLLSFDVAMLVRQGAETVAAADYPDTWRQGDLELALSYQFEPGAAADGVTVHVPLAVLNRVRPDGFDWQVPGLRPDLVTALVKSLPKDVRRQLVPAPDTAAAVMAELGGRVAALPLVQAVADAVRRRRGVVVPADLFDLARVPDHLRMTFRVEDDNGAALGEGKDLDALCAQLAPEVRQTVARAGTAIERAGLTAWSVGALPEVVEEPAGELTVRGFPALVDDGQTVAVRVLSSADEQRREHWRGVRRLLTLTIPSPVKGVVARLDGRTKLALGHNPHGSVPALLADCVDCAADFLMADHGGAVREPAAFDRLRDAVRAELAETTYDVVLVVGRILAVAHDVTVRAGALTGSAAQPAVTDIRRQLGRLVPPGFVTATGRDRLRHLERYLKAVTVRLDDLAAGEIARDAIRMADVEVVEGEVETWLASFPRARRTDSDVESVRWMVEELRVSLFAQRLGTPAPVSPKRIYRAMAAVDAAAG